MTRPKTGGRKPGSLNKRTKFLSDLLEQEGFDWSKEFSIAFAANDWAKVRALTDLLPYMAPKLAQREVVEETPTEDASLSGEETQDLLKVVKNS
jgi:hypothetical protein